MAARSDQLSSADCRGLADLHIRCLPDSLVSKLGRRYAEAFYRYIARSRQEFAFVHREAGQILSACILSLSPKTLDRRLVTGTSLLFFAALRMLRLPMGKPVTKPMPQKRLSAGGAPGDGGAALDSAPEVILLYTAAESRNRSLGSAVLERCESFLFAQGLRHYTVKTLDDDANRALRYYARQGFVERRRFRKHGKAYQLLEKRLTGQEKTRRTRDGHGQVGRG